MAELAEVSPYTQELVEAWAKANHNYFANRQQSRLPWEELNPLYRHSAMTAHLEILLDGPAQLIAREINNAKGEAPVLRLRIEMFIAELRERDSDNTDPIVVADELQALIDRPLDES